MRRTARFGKGQARLRCKTQDELSRPSRVVGGGCEEQCVQPGNVIGNQNSHKEGEATEYFGRSRPQETIMSRSFVITLIMSCVLISYPAIAQEKSPGEPSNIHIGRGVICDTQEQATRYVALFDGDTDKAISDVNREANKDDACMVAAVAFISNSADVTREPTARNDKQGTFRIIPIVIMGVLTPAGVQQIPPFSQYAPVKVEEIEA
jgi:hypothetical protein